MTKLDMLCTVLEYALAFMFIRGGLLILISGESLVLPGILTYLVGAEAIVVYGAMFLITGILLVYAKLAKAKRLHKFILLFMFLTCVYVIALSIVINGLAPRLLISLTVALVSGAMWLRWKFRTEYIDTHTFKEETKKELLAEE